jgi:hypothetical protein
MTDLAPPPTADLHPERSAPARVRALAALMEHLPTAAAQYWMAWLRGQPRPEQVAALHRLWRRGQCTPQAAATVTAWLDGTR